MKYVVAVSGGVDSVVLLDMLMTAGGHEVVVAHFDHGIRANSDRDAAFVAALAERYGVPYESRREELGPKASEATARERRYEFLRSIAKKHEATLATAHHRDDVIETIAINLTRGTGWRGLAVLGDGSIARPLTGHAKRELYDYAVSHHLEWVEDETNATDAYLRNRLRAKLAALPEKTKLRVSELWHEQNTLKRSIDEESTALKTTSRYFMTMIDETSAQELLRAILIDTSLSLTRPQRKQLLLAIKTARPGTKFEAGAGCIVEFGRRDFIVKHPL